MATIAANGGDVSSVIQLNIVVYLKNFSRSVMLRAMLDAAINWIRAGLPMTCLKIVLYRRDPSWLSKDEQGLVKLFTDMRDKIAKIKAIEEVN